MQIVLADKKILLDGKPAARFEAIFKHRLVKSGDYFINAGDPSTLIAIVVKGLFRSFITDEKGNDVTKYFYPEGSVLFSYAAHVTGEPSAYSVQALETSNLLVATISNFEKLMEDDHQLALMFKRVMDFNMMMKDRHASSFVLFNGMERYQQFLEEYPGLEKRIKQHQLASYLGITPVSLSRIRKKIDLIK